MNRQSFFTSLLFVLMFLPSMALAAGNIDIKIKAQKLTTVIKDGKKMPKAVPTSKFQPGDTIVYTITYTNNSNEPVTNAEINDPIPDGTAYIPDSAKGEGTEITFSIDKGKTFHKPTLLYYEVGAGSKKKEKKVASPDLYTNIRWTIAKPLPPKASGSVSFNVLVK